MTKFDELKEMIKEIKESIDSAKTRIEEAEKAQIEAEAEIESLSFNLDTLVLAAEAVEEEVQRVEAATKEKVKEAVGTLLAKANGAITEADINEAICHVYGEDEEPDESEPDEINQEIAA